MRPLLRIAVALGVAPAVVPACFDGSDLEGAECHSDADCWTGQTCARSPTQNAEMLAGMDATACICCRSGEVAVEAADGYLICSASPDGGSSSTG